MCDLGPTWTQHHTSRSWATNLAKMLCSISLAYSMTHIGSLSSWVFFLFLSHMCSQTSHVRHHMSLSMCNVSFSVSVIYLCFCISLIVISRGTFVIGVRNISIRVSIPFVVEV